MKGIIIYSSKTGNTKRAAEHIHEGLKDLLEVEIASIDENKNPEDYDFAIIGAWIEKGMPDSKSKKLIKSTNQENLGIFVTLGAMPDSEHGLKVKSSLEKLLEDKNSLGEYRLPGLVDPNLTKKLDSIVGKLIPEDVKNKMKESSLNSRYATIEELEEASKFFREKILKTMGGKKDEI